MPKLTPWHNNLVIEPFQLGEVTKSGFLIPQIAKASTPYRYGKVLAVGPGRYAGDGHLIPCSARVGDIIAYAVGKGVAFPLDDDAGIEHEYMLVNEAFCMGTIEGMPEQSKLTGLDGRLLTMSPGSRARDDQAYRNLDALERAQKQGIIDSVGGTLERIEREDQADYEAEGEPS